MRCTIQELQKSRNIIRRIRQRDLYRMVDQKILPGEYKKVWNAKTLTPAMVAAQDAVLEPSDVIIDFSRINFGLGAYNPVDRIRFFGKHNPNRNKFKRSMKWKWWLRCVFRCFPLSKGSDIVSGAGTIRGIGPAVLYDRRFASTTFFCL